MRVNNTHLQNPLIPRKRQPQGQIENWFDLKGAEKKENSQKEKIKEIRLSIFIRGE